MPDIFIPKSPKTEKHIRVPLLSTNSKEHNHPFASFCDTPSNISFHNQEPDEKIVLLLRRHFITNFSWIIITVILVLLPLLTNILGINIQAFLPFFPARFFMVGLIFYYLIIFSYAFINFITWYYNIFLVTQKRIVDIDFSDIVYHNVAITKLNLVEDVNYTQVGFIPSLFNFGDLFVQTAGEVKHFEALKIPKPNDATHIIQDLIGGKHHV